MIDKIKSDNTNFYHDDEISLKELFLILWSRKKTIIFITSLSAFLSILIALSITNTYTSKSLLSPTEPQDSLSSKLGGLSSISGMAGFSLPNSPSSQSQEGIERIKSFEFFSTFFLPNIKLENIMAVKKWIRQENILIYNKKLFDADSNKWVRDVQYPKKEMPSEQEAYKVYKKILTVTEDDNTSFISISIDHKSPIIAKKWVDIIINEINESMRKIDADTAKKSVSYLNETAKTVKIQSMKEIISSLLENQIKTLMLISSNKSYVFKVIDSPIISEEKSKPNRALICIFGTLLGGMLSLFIVFFLHYRENLNTN
mgnify:CR=1 FL=1